MKKTTATLISIVAAASLALAGCSGKGTTADSAATASASASASADVPVDRNYTGTLPTVSGEFAKSATIEAGTGEKPTTVVAHTIVEGSGREVTTNDYLKVHYAGVLWDDGKVFDTSFERPDPTDPSKTTAIPAGFALSGVIPGWTYGLAGQHVGDRVELVIPPQYGYGEQGAGDSIPGNATLVFVVDILDAVDLSDTSSLGSATPTDESIAGVTVTGDLGAKPTLSFTDGASAPTEMTVVTLATGSGKVLDENDTMFYHETTSPWGKADQTESSYDLGHSVPSPGAIGKNEFFSGRTVGSRLLIVVPSQQDPAQIVVSVIDIVGSVAMN